MEFQDTCTEALSQIIEAKREHREPPKLQEPESKAGQIVDLIFHSIPQGLLMHSDSPPIGAWTLQDAIPKPAAGRIPQHPTCPASTPTWEFTIRNVRKG